MKALAVEASEPGRGMAESARFWFEAEVLSELARQGVDVSKLTGFMGAVVVEYLGIACGVVYKAPRMEE